MNYGFTADEAMDKMMMLGDISQGSADKMSRIAMAYGQMSSAGKVSLEDVKQMIEAGFNPLQEISESTGESMDSLYGLLYTSRVGTCPNCLVEVSDRFNVCLDCGQKLDWSEWYERNPF